MTKDVSTVAKKSLASLSDEEIRELDWYYEVELRPGVFTKGSRFINMLPTRELLERVDIGGLRMLDIGTQEGAFSVLASHAGANVTSYDRLNLSDRIALVKQAYACDFLYLQGLPFDTFADEMRRSGQALFDFVLFSGVLYHVIDPGLFLYNVRSLLRNGGILLLETSCAIDSDAALFFNERGRFYKGTNYYQPSTGWLDYFLRLIGFRIIDVEYVLPAQPLYDNKRIPRLAVTCVLSPDSILEDDDEWGAKRLTLRELARNAPICTDPAIDFSGRLRTASYASGLYRSRVEAPSLDLAKVLALKEPIPLNRSKCIMRLEDRLGARL